MADPFELDRFVRAQAVNYSQALAEIRAGAKRSHWMWYVFPQIAGLGHSDMARRYAIRSGDEARAYLAHEILGPRYHASVEALQSLANPSADAVFGRIDALKLRSSLTLFETVEPAFGAVLDCWFAGARDPATLARLSGRPSS